MSQSFALFLYLTLPLWLVAQKIVYSFSCVRFLNLFKLNVVGLTSTAFTSIIKMAGKRSVSAFNRILTGITVCFPCSVARKILNGNFRSVMATTCLSKSDNIFFYV